MLPGFSNLGGIVNDNVIGKQLLKAAGDGDLNELRKLLNEGAPFTADWLGTSPLHLCAQRNHFDVCQFLLRGGLSINARTKVDKTPLHMAAYEGHLEIVRLLLNQDAEVDCIDMLGMTPLHWAVQKGHASIVEILLRAGADKTIHNNFNLSPVDIAHQIEREDIINLLEVEIKQDALEATENLANELAAENEGGKPGLIEDLVTYDIDEESQELEQSSSEDVQMESSMKLLQDYGITMLPNDDDDNNILSTVMESGHSVVLTEVGKQILDSVKAAEDNEYNLTGLVKGRNFITVTVDEFMKLAANNSIPPNEAQGLVNQLNDNNNPKTIKRIVMKKNRSASTPLPNILKQRSIHLESDVVVTQRTNEADIEIIMKKLADTRKVIEEYKRKIMEKEVEAEKYRQQLNFLLEQS